MAKSESYDSSIAGEDYRESRPDIKGGGVLILEMIIDSKRERCWQISDKRFRYRESKFPLAEEEEWNWGQW